MVQPGRWWRVVALAAVVCSTAHGAVALDATSSARDEVDPGETLSWSHTVSGSNRLLVVGLTFGEYNPPGLQLPTVTFAGVAMKPIHRIDSLNGASAQWYLVNPPTGTHLVQVGPSQAADAWIAGATSWTGVDPNVPFSNGQTASGTTPIATLTFQSAPDEVVMDNVGFFGVPGGPSLTAGAGQLQQWQYSVNVRTGAGSYSPGGSTVTVSYASQAGGLNWHLTALSIKPAPPLPTVSTSAPANVTGASATLQGAANPRGTATTAWFRYGATQPNGCNDTFGTRVPNAGGIALGTGTTQVPFSQTVNNLAAGTTYYVCAFAANGGGTAAGQLVTFTPTWALGQACQRDGDCASGECADGVCCNAHCGGGCEACNLEGTVGQCMPRPAQEDPEGACGSGPCAGACNGQGACLFPNATRSCGVCAVCNGAGQCGVAADGTSCADESYCNGEETCLGGSCGRAAPVECDAQGPDLLVCNELAKACIPSDGVPPRILRDAVPTAAVGRPYPFNEVGAVRVQGPRPMRFEACGGPPAFRVEPNTGVVSFLPAATGPVALCVRARNPYGEDTYAFNVEVGPTPSFTPMARMRVAPSEGAAPLQVEFDGAASSVPEPGRLVRREWDFADGRPPTYGGLTRNTYLLPGGYLARLTVTDDRGGADTTRQAVRVLDRLGHRPAVARIRATATSGQGSLETVLSCDCAPGDAPITAYRWTVSDGRTAVGPELVLPLEPGRVHVLLEVLDENGLSSFDKVSLTLAATSGQKPPACAVFVDPPSTPAATTVQHLATYADSDGVVTDSLLSAGNASSEATALSVAYSAPGTYPVTLQVRDDSGLTCSDVALVQVVDGSGLLPPRIVSLPETQASCGLPYAYASLGPPQAAGGGPVRWRLEPGAPEGMTLNPDTGELSWTPTREQTGVHTVQLRVDNAAGSDLQAFDVEVSCQERNYAVRNGCGAAGNGATALTGLGLWLAAAAALRARRRVH